MFLYTSSILHLLHYAYMYYYLVTVDILHVKHSCKFHL